jgi:glycerophosphoryl diester phosphodiesterase
VIDLRRRDGRVLRIGHRGAAALARENTLDSLTAAALHRVDAIEFDVLPTPQGGLVLAHSTIHDGLATLDEALGLLAVSAPEVGIQLDLKRPGYEEAALDALRRHDALGRSFVSSAWPRSLATISRLEPALPLALTYPRDRHGIGRRTLFLPLVAPAVVAMRELLPHTIGRRLEGSRASAATLHWSVVSRAVVRRCHARGAAVLAWTVDGADLARRLVRTGVDGIITNDPRIFDGGQIA